MPNRIQLISLFVTLLVLMLVSCKDRYNPGIISSPNSYLVVEGVLTVGDTTMIRISRTSRLDDRGITPETNATVTVEGKDNINRQLVFAGNGFYQSPDLGLSVGAEYRLRIVTNGGKEYLSDYIMARQTPAIDSITWRRDNDGVDVLANTHDPSGNTRYYRWEYDETWEVRSFYTSSWKYIPDSNIVRSRLPGEDVFTGWKFDSFNSILIGSSASLQSDVIIRNPLNFIQGGDEKLGVRYSILVRQYALDKTGYGFYELMKKNTEELGTIFDAQPSEAKGNIHNVTDPAETVIGYITASTVEEKRIFILNSEVAGWGFRQDCPTRNVPNDPDSIRAWFQGGYLPIDFDGVKYLSSFGRCIDVTRRGATLTQPAYW